MWAKIKHQKKYLFLIFLVLIAVGERLWFDLGTNVELVTLATFIAAFYLDRKSALLVALLSLAISDAILGNKSIMLFTWSSYVVIAVCAALSKRFAKSSPTRILTATMGGAGASVWFYLWTNFGVWLLDSFDMYTNDAAGLMNSYIAGVPFFKAQLFGNAIIVPAGFILLEFFSFLYQYKKRHIYKLT